MSPSWFLEVLEVPHSAQAHTLLDKKNMTQSCEKMSSPDENEGSEREGGGKLGARGAEDLELLLTVDKLEAPSFSMAPRKHTRLSLT